MSGQQNLPNRLLIPVSQLSESANEISNLKYLCKFPGKTIEKYCFFGPENQLAICDLRIFRNIIIVSERTENTGPSAEKSIRYLINTLTVVFSIDPRRLVLIHHSADVFKMINYHYDSGFVSEHTWLNLTEDEVEFLIKAAANVVGRMIYEKLKEEESFSRREVQS
jgi:hypothetical protein